MGAIHLGFIPPTVWGNLEECVGCLFSFLSGISIVYDETPISKKRTV